MFRLVTLAKQRFDKNKELDDTSTDVSTRSHTDADEEIDEVDMKDMNAQEKEMATSSDRRRRLRPLAVLVKLLTAFNSIAIQFIIIGISALMFIIVALLIYFAQPAGPERCKSAGDPIARIMMVSIIIGLLLIVVAVVIDFITYARDFFRCKCLKVCKI